MNEDEFYQTRSKKRPGGDSSTSAETQINVRKKPIIYPQPARKPGMSNNVGKEGGNPEYRKNVI